MRRLPIITLIVSLAAGVAISICKPEFLAENRFLEGFVNHEYINVLAVIVTVSMVSVVQIHLEYTRIERRFKVKVFGDARRAVNSSALILTGMLALAFAISFVRAQVGDEKVAVSIVHTIALLTILEAIFIMYDLVDTVCTMAEEEPIDAEDDASQG